MDISPDAPLFDELLALNPWARAPFEARRQMIADGVYNVNALNQGGNPATRDWMTSLHAARSEATLARFQSGGHWDWNEGIFNAVVPLFEDPEFSATRAGTPLIPKGSGGLADFSKTDVAYGLGPFKADVLMLCQASLRGLSVEALDISTMPFTIGLDLLGANVANLEARETQFGPFSEASSAALGLFDGAGAEFFGGISFTPSHFTGPAIFASATFMGWAGFTAVRFDDVADFSDAAFLEDAEFSGAFFAGDAEFRGAGFQAGASFGLATFEAGVDFTDVDFARAPGVSDLPKDVRAAILGTKRR